MAEITKAAAWKKGYRTGHATQADWDDALIRFTTKYCAHSTWGGMCELCHAWCDGFSGIELHDGPCDH